MIKISFTPEFLEWVALQMRANNTGLDAQQFALEFFHRAFAGRGAKVSAAAPLLLEALIDLLAWADIQDHHSAQAVSIRGRAWAAIAAARGEQ